MTEGSLPPAGALPVLVASDEFPEYCRLRSIAYHGRRRRRMARVGAAAWLDAIHRLPPDRRADILEEVAAVASLSSADGNAHLLAAGRDGDQPPADIPAGAPLALWFLVHRPTLFREVFLHHAGEEPVWRAARAVRRPKSADLTRKAGALAESLRRVFSCGTDEHCDVAAGRLAGAFQFHARVRGRPHLVEAFNDRGTLDVARFCPALSVHFAYDPQDGLVYVRASAGTVHPETSLLRCFGQAVLGAPVQDGPVFSLDALAFPFAPLPDGHEVATVRVRALHFQYPARLARRVVKLETPPGDGPGGIASLVRTHVGPDGDVRELQVCYAELHVGLRADGRTQNVRVRLWPDRCSLPEGPIGIRLRRHLRTWGLLHGR